MFILPINKDGYVGKRPYVFIALAILNGVFLAAIYMFSTERAVFELYGFTPATPTIKTLFTSMFLHAGILHYAGNMFFLWMFGYRVENTFGRSLFIIVYLVCGIGATAAHYIFNATSAGPCVGASGAISGIVGCYFVLFPRSRFNIEIYLIRFKVVRAARKMVSPSGT